MLRRWRKLPLRTRPLEVTAKPFGTRPRQECQTDNLAASREEHKLFNKYAAVVAAEALVSPKTARTRRSTAACEPKIMDTVYGKVAQEMEAYPVEVGARALR